MYKRKVGALIRISNKNVLTLILDFMESITKKSHTFKPFLKSSLIFCTQLRFDLYQLWTFFVCSSFQNRHPCHRPCHHPCRHHPMLPVSITTCTTGKINANTIYPTRLFLLIPRPVWCMQLCTNQHKPDTSSHCCYHYYYCYGWLIYGWMDGWSIFWAFDLESWPSNTSESSGATQCGWVQRFSSSKTNSATVTPVGQQQCCTVPSTRWQWRSSNWHDRRRAHTSCSYRCCSDSPGWRHQPSCTTILLPPEAQNYVRLILKVFFSISVATCVNAWVRESLLCDELDNHQVPQQTRLIDSQPALWWVASGFKSSEPVDTCSIQMLIKTFYLRLKRRRNASQRRQQV